MPGVDITGPEGYGGRTGRGLCYCLGYDSPGLTKGAPRGGLAETVVEDLVRHLVLTQKCMCPNCNYCEVH